MRAAHCMVPQKYERHTSRIGGTSGGLGRGAHTRDLYGKILIEPTYEPGACWLWRGYLDKDGYGKMTVKGPLSVRAHRWIWEQERHAIGRGEVLINLCGKRSCVNPSHKRIGKQIDAIHNLREAGRAGHSPDNRGEMSARAKLREDDVLFIRSQRSCYGLVPVLAQLYGVSKVTIAKIRERYIWKHLGNGNKGNAMPLAQLRELLAQRNAAAESIDDLAQSRTEGAA